MSSSPSCSGSAVTSMPMIRSRTMVKAIAIRVRPPMATTAPAAPSMTAGSAP